MKLTDIILEIISPRKPERVKSSRSSVSGVQGSMHTVNKRDFTTSKGNAVSVRFKPSMEDGMKSVDVSFFVNGTMDDSASTEGKDVDNDFEILSGVLHVGMQYVDRARMNRITFTAHTGSKDSKLVHNLPTDKYVAALKSTAAKFKEDLINFKIDPAEQEKYNIKMQEFAKKFKLDPAAMEEKKYIYKDELIQLLNDVINDKHETPEESKYNRYVSILRNHSRVVERWDSYRHFEHAMYELMKVIQSHREGGTYMNRNRREGIYKRMINKYFSKDWNIEHHGTMFTMTRKNPI